MLSQHPQIFMPDVKEPWFFARELRSRFDKPSTRSRPNTLEDYLALFAGAARDQLAGEASPQYVRSRARRAGNRRRCARTRGSSCCCASRRAFLRSLHLQLVATHIEDEPDFGRAIALEARRREGKHVPSRSLSPQSLLYSDHVRYAEQLRALHDAFPPEQVLVLDLRGLPPRQRGRPAPGAGVPRRRPARADRARRDQAAGGRALDAPAPAAPRDPQSRAEPGQARARSCRRSTRSPPRSLSSDSISARLPPRHLPPASARRRRADAGAAPAFQARGAGRRRLPRSRSGDAVGL